MTKASELLDKQSQLKLVWTGNATADGGGYPFTASLTERGLFLQGASLLKPAEALQFGKWLVEMYSERP